MVKSLLFGDYRSALDCYDGASDKLPNLAPPPKILTDAEWLEQYARERGLRKVRYTITILKNYINFC